MEKRQGPSISVKMILATTLLIIGTVAGFGLLDVWNIGRYRNEKVDAALRDANTNPDEAKRLEALGEAQRLVWEDAPYLWLQVNENVSAARKGVSGIELWPIVFTSLRKAKTA